MATALFYRVFYVVIITFFAVSIIILFMHKSAYAVDAATVLPKGIFRAWFLTAQSEIISQEINSDGKLENYGSRLNRSVTVDDLVLRDPRIGQLVNTLNTIEPGLGSKLMSANLYSDMNLSTTAAITALEYGVNDRLSIGINIPIFRRKVSANFNAISVNNATATGSHIGDISPDLQNALYQFGIESFDRGMFVKSIFTAKGYDAPSSFDKTELGDVVFGGKYNFYKNEHFYSTALLGARAPTGSTPSLTNIYDKGCGSGSWGIAGALYEEYLPKKSISFVAMQKLSYAFSDTRERAVPKNQDDALPSLLAKDGQVQNVTRTQALSFDSELSSTLRLLRDSELSIWGAYQFSAKGKDQYSGPGDLYYAGLENATDNISHNLEIGAGYSTIPAYRRKAFSVPGEIQLVYNSVIDGKNIPYMNYAYMNLMIYF
ncbi:MAG: hypothetical protein A2Z20_11345 [Bdellovibrionales bacterium RBG_16_40_8]|nr:MAG: hypothetical protein A2Z20_11345 [Bdellovibrionales bacterium RBG_16_40_8]